MTPVDGITPPIKNQNKRPLKNKTVKKPVAPKKRTPKTGQTNDQFENPIKQINNNTTNKHSLVWIVSIIIVFGIFIGWSSLIFGGKIINNNSTSDQAGFFEEFTKDISKIWDKFKTDYLKIQKAVEETQQNEEERIKQLKEKIFPDFDQNN